MGRIAREGVFQVRPRGRSGLAPEWVELGRKLAWQGGGCLLERKGPVARVGRGLCLRCSGVRGAGKCWKQRGDMVLLADNEAS